MKIKSQGSPLFLCQHSQRLDRRADAYLDDLPEADGSHVGPPYLGVARI